MNMHAVDIRRANAVVMRFLHDQECTEPSELPQLPRVLEAGSDRSLEFLVSFCQENRAAIRQDCDRYGAVLLRGFEVETPQHFQSVLQALDIDLDPVFDLEPQARGRLAAAVFESSAYKLPWLALMPHTEMVYSARRPMTIAFWCGLAPAVHGETPLSDFNAVYDRLPPEIRRRLDTCPMRVIRRLPWSIFARNIRRTRRRASIGTRWRRPVAERATRCIGAKRVPRLRFFSLQSSRTRGPANGCSTTSSFPAGCGTSSWPRPGDVFRTVLGRS